MLRLPMVALLGLLAACAKSNTPDDGGPGRDAGRADAGGSDAGSADAGACPARIEEGTRCAPEGLSCSSSPCTDPCSFCNAFNCSGGEWVRVEAFPLPCFDCGERRCIVDEQYCDIERSDVAGRPDVFDCRDMPEACRAEPTCACVEPLVPANRCSGEPGQLTLEHFGG